MTYPQFIYLCGIDGSGKTTQMNIIKRHVEKSNLKHSCVWLRWTAFTSYPFLAIARLLGYTKWKENPRSNTRYPEHNFYSNRAIANLWPWLFTIDMRLKTLSKVDVPLAKGQLVLCDRFVVDAMVDLMVETGNTSLPDRTVGRLLLSLIPKSSVNILLDLDEKEAYSRKKDTPDLKYLKKRRALYLNLASRLAFHVVDARKNPDEVTEDIARIALRHYPFWYLVQPADL